ncbi:MAG: hypothetical protein ACI8Y6_001748, partial [Brevundimonas sp.]
MAALSCLTVALENDTSVSDASVRHNTIIDKRPTASGDHQMAQFQPTAPLAHKAVNANRYIIVPCEADGSSDLAVIWDRLEEQVVDVISAAASSR